MRKSLHPTHGSRSGADARNNSKKKTRKIEGKKRQNQNICLCVTVSRHRYAWNHERGDPAQPYHYQHMVEGAEKAGKGAHTTVGWVDVGWCGNGCN